MTVRVAQLFNKAGNEHRITSKPAVLVNRVMVKWEMSVSSVPDEYLEWFGHAEWQVSTLRTGKRNMKEQGCGGTGQYNRHKCHGDRP